MHLKAPYYKYTFFLRLLLCFLLLSTNSKCNRKQAASASADTEKGTVAHPQILYLSFESKIDSATGNYSIKIIQQQLANGLLKEQTVSDQKENYWQLLLFDAKHKQIDSIHFANPHIRHMEYINEEGVLAIKKIIAARVEIPIRLNYKTAIKELSIISIEDKKEKQYSARH